MTTNKAHGQTLDFVGIYLPEDVFTQWHWYVAFNRVRNFSYIAVFTADNEGYTKNIVCKEVLW